MIRLTSQTELLCHVKHLRKAFQMIHHFKALLDAVICETGNIGLLLSILPLFF